MPEALQDKVAVVTGGCFGIGLAIVDAVLAEGGRVVVADIQDKKGRALEAERPDRIAYSHCDVMREDHLQAAMATARQTFGGLDILVNNAGANRVFEGIMDMSADGWDATHALLLRGPMLGIKHAAPLMIERGGGSIVNIASIAGVEAGWSLAYGVAKAGVIHLTKLAAAELAVHNIRVNAISPGLIVNPLFGLAFGLSRPDAEAAAETLADAAAAMQPIRRGGRPEDIAQSVLHFASDRSGFVTGAHLVVDGGVTVGPRTAWDDQAKTPMAVAIDETRRQYLSGTAEG